MPAALVFAAAPIRPTPRLTARVAALASPLVIAADDGASTALALGLTPDLVIGDLDSIAAGTLDELRRRSVAFDAYPRDKNATDGQLAIERALQSRPDELYLVGFLGGPRLDQALANILMLSRIEVPALLLDNHNECRLVRPGAPLSWRAEPDELVSLIPLTATVDGVCTAGLRWRLDEARLLLGDTRGISNEPVAPEVSVQSSSGLMLVTRHFPH